MRAGLLDNASGSRVYVDLDQEETFTDGQVQLTPAAGSVSVESGIDQLTVHELESLSDILVRAALHLRKIAKTVR